MDEDRYSDLQLCTLRELAEGWRVSERTIRRQIARAENPLPCVRIGRAIRFRPAAVMAWVLEEEAAGREVEASAAGPIGPRPSVPAVLLAGSKKNTFHALSPSAHGPRAGAGDTRRLSVITGGGA